MTADRGDAASHRNERRGNTVKLAYPMGRLPQSHRERGANILRFLMIPLACFLCFGSPDPLGLTALLSRFVPPAYFILSGHSTLLHRREVRLSVLRHEVKRTFRFFAAMLLCLLLLNAVYLTAQGAGGLSELLSLRQWFDFLVLNIWPFPIGDGIWFIQSMFHAYVILYLLDRLNLLRFYGALLLPGLALTVLTGELAGVVGFSVAGHAFLPAGTFTCALPYMLLGMLLRSRADALRELPGELFASGFLLGAMLGVAEWAALLWTGRLVYEGHMLGFGLMAVSVCCFFLFTVPKKVKDSFAARNGKTCARIVYAIAQPAYFLITLAAGALAPGFLPALERTHTGGVMICLVCLALCLPVTAYRHSRAPSHDGKHEAHKI